MTLTSPPPACVVLLAEPFLVEESVRVALTSRGIDTCSLPWPGADGYPSLRDAVDSVQPLAGLLLGGLDDDPARRAAAREIVRAVPVRWLLLVNSPDDAEWGSLVDAGVSGMLPTSAGLDDLAHALDDVMSGRELMTPGQRDRSIAAWHELEEQQRGPAEQMISLTPRELSVLNQLYDGVSVTTISERGEVSVSTVRSQVKAVLRKLGVSSQLEAVAVYRRVLEHLPSLALDD